MTKTKQEQEWLFQYFNHREEQAREKALFQYLNHCEEQAREKAAAMPKPKRRRHPTETERMYFELLEQTTRQISRWPTRKELADHKIEVETRERLRLLCERGSRGPEQLATEKYADGECFTEISRLMELHRSKPHRATELVVRDLVTSGKLSTDKTKEKSHVHRIYKKFLQQR